MLLNLDSIPPFYKKYVKLLEETDLMQALRISGHRAQEFIHAVPEGKADFRYGPDKWTVREVFCHMLDGERIFAYRALRFARNDKTPLAGFDEQQYAPEMNAQNRSMKSIAFEMSHLRASTIDLFSGFSLEMLSRKGVANNTEMSVASLGYTIAGHETHHINILKERYVTAWN